MSVSRVAVDTKKRKVQEKYKKMDEVYRAEGASPRLRQLAREYLTLYKDYIS